MRTPRFNVTRDRDRDGGTPAVCLVRRISVLRADPGPLRPSNLEGKIQAASEAEPSATVSPVAEGWPGPAQTESP